MNKNNLPESTKREVIQSFLITSARYKFSIYEKRILTKIITNLQPLIEGQHLTGKIERSLFGDIKVELPLLFLTDNDSNREQYKQALRSLATKGIEYEDDKVWTFCNLIQSPKIVKNTGKVTFTICNEMVDLFLNFTKGYSKYILSISLSLQSVASARMYELMSNQQHPIRYSVDKLKKMLDVENKYPRTSNFIQRVLLPAKKELDEKANWSFDYRPIAVGRKFEYIDLIPINHHHRESEEIQKADAVRRTNLSWYVEKDIRYFLINTCLFSQRELKNNLVTIQKFCNTFADDALNKIMEIWSRSQDKSNPKGYLIKVLQLETEY